MITEKKIQNKKRLFKILIPIILIICIILLAQFAWAKYMTALKGDSKADIAKWTFKVTDGESEDLVIDLSNTRAGIQQQAEVQDGYIGPGTSGKFIIEVDATNTEVSLEYNINIAVDYTDNNKFPKNLIFYSDSEMKNAIYHTDKAINLNGFIAQNVDNKITSYTIYWKWDFETGQSQTDKDSNDVADSYWIGRSILIPITVVGKQANQNPYSNQYEVTFDAAGGIIKGYGNSEKMSKNVNFDGPLEELPVPTKVNYQFDGWVGNNILNYNNILQGATSWRIAVDENGYVKMEGDLSDGRIWRYSSCNWTMRLEPGTYTLSLEFAKQATNTKVAAIQVISSDERILLSSNDITFKDKKSFELNITEATNIGILVKSVEGIYRIKLEKGDVSTDWEPYKIITSEAELNNANNKTLTAQWTRNISEFDGRNLLNYNNISQSLSYWGIEVDDDGYVSDISPESDAREWNYSNSNWKMTIEPGTYTLALYFRQQATNTEYSRLIIVQSDGRTKAG